MSGTPRLALPFLSPGQAQKELFHNEALQILDAVVAAAVEQAPLSSPPPAPAPGACYIVAAGATGEWAGRDLCLAEFTSGGWRYVRPIEGMTVYVRSAGVWAVFISGAWEIGALRGSSVVIDGQRVIGSREGAISGASGGTTIDTQARATIDQILMAMRAHGLIEP